MKGSKERLIAIGNRVKVVREAMDLTQEEFANRYGYARTTLAKLEAGLRDFKSTELVTLAEQLNVSCDYLLGSSHAGELTKIMLKITLKKFLACAVKHHDELLKELALEIEI